MSAVKRIYLHIGLHKTGTTYVQHLMRANRTALRDQGVLYPGGQGFPPQIMAIWDLLGRRPQRGEDGRIAGSWQALVTAVNAAPEPTVLISEEHLSVARPRQIRAAVGAFPHHEAHVVVTARDLARVLASAWQEDVKAGNSLSWREFVAAVRDPEQVGSNPSRGFWFRQGLPDVLARWSKVVPIDRVHVVTLPPAGESPEVLVQRLGSLVGFDPARLGEPAAWSNPNVGLVGTELIRLLNPALAGLNQRQRDRLLKFTLARLLADGIPKVPLEVTGDDLAWARERGAEMAAAVRAAGHPVVGDLAELEPRPVPGRSPEDLADRELLDAAVVGLGGLSTAYVGAWWTNRRPDEKVEGHERAKLGSAARAAASRARHRVGRIADRNPVASRALGAVLRWRRR